MRLTEAQGKQLFERAGIAVPRGSLAHTAGEAAAIAAAYTDGCAVKAQVLAPNRALHGGIRFAETAGEAEAAAAELLRATVQGERVSAVLVEERLSVAAELYVAVRLNASRRCIDVIASRAGGSGIEERALAHPEQFVVASHRRNVPFMPYEARTLAQRLGLEGPALLACADVIARLYDAFCRFDARLLEINPLALLHDGCLVALDAVALVDDDALFRQPELEAIGVHAGEEKPRQPTQRELVAAEIDRADYRGVVHYVDLDPAGEVGVIAVGSGFSIALMDMLAAAGLTQANFCDCSGNPSADKVRRATRLVLSIPSVRGLIFASGVVSQPLDVTARGILAAFAEAPPRVPVVIRLAGNQDREGCALLRAAGFSHVYSREHDVEDCIAELRDLMRRAPAADATALAHAAEMPQA